MLLTTLGSPPGFTRRILSPLSEESLKPRRRCAGSLPPATVSQTPLKARIYIVVPSGQLPVLKSPASTFPLPKPPDLNPVKLRSSQPPEKPEPPDPPPDPPDSLLPMVPFSDFKDLHHLPPPPTSPDLCDNNRFSSHQLLDLRLSINSYNKEPRFAMWWRLSLRTLFRLSISCIRMAKSFNHLLYRNPTLSPFAREFFLGFAYSSYLDMSSVICFQLIDFNLDVDELSRRRQNISSEIFSGSSRRSLSHPLRLVLRILHLMGQSSACQRLISMESPLTKNPRQCLPSVSILSGGSPSQPVMNIFPLTEGFLSDTLSVKLQSYVFNELHSSAQSFSLDLHHESHIKEFAPTLSPTASAYIEFIQTFKGSILFVSHHKAFSTSSLALERSLPSSSLFWERTLQSYLLHWKRLVTSSSCYEERYFNPFTDLLFCSQDATDFVLVTSIGSKDWFSKSRHNVIISIESGSSGNLISTQLRPVSSSLSLRLEELS